MGDHDPQANKALVLDFYRRVFWKQDVAAVREFCAADVRVHAPDGGQGLAAMEQSVRETFAPSAPASPGGAPMPEPALAVADEDIVVVCFSMPQPEPHDPGATFDFFSFDAYRVREGEITERWPSINRAAPTQLSWETWGDGIPRPRPSAHGPDPDRAKHLAVDFYRQVFDGQNAEAAKHFVTDDYQQHGRHYPQGRPGLENLLTQLFPSGPRPAPESMTLPHVLLAAEGDIVVTAGLLPQPHPDEPNRRYPYYVFTAYALRDGMLAEHWSGVSKAAPPQHA